MSQLTNVLGASGTSSGQLPKKDVLSDVNLDDFLKLMITELQNQDPLNPLENDQLINQIGAIREIAATDKLSNTLESALLGQNIASATNLIGADIDGLSDDGQKVTGVVERVSVADGAPKLHLSLQASGAASRSEGNMEKGDYEYRVVWESDGKLVAVDPFQDSKTGANRALHIDGRKGKDQAIQLSNLPISDGPKQVYRKSSASGDFQLVGTIRDGKTATFLDTAATKDLSAYVLPGEPSLITGKREFEVKLQNVGEIRPPAVLETTSTADKGETEG
jgi:flagellar basal-body rod modification protein FlgD